MKTFLEWMNENNQQQVISQLKKGDIFHLPHDPSYILYQVWEPASHLPEAQIKAFPYDYSRNRSYGDFKRFHYNTKVNVVNDYNPKDYADQDLLKNMELNAAGETAGDDKFGPEYTDKKYR